MNSSSKRFSKPLTSGALLGVTALAVSGGCNRQSSELQAMDAKALAGPPPPMPAMPGQVAAPMQAGSMPPGMQNGARPAAAPLAASAPSAASVPNVMSATAPVAPALAPAPMSDGSGKVTSVSARAAVTPAAAPVVTVAPVAVAPVAAPVANYNKSAVKPAAKVSMVLATPAGASARLVPGTLALKAQLKRLWNKGAAAKHRGDIAGARRAWLAARKLAPQWPGFQESLDKLA